LITAEKDQQKIIGEKTKSVQYEKIINRVLHYYESIKISPGQAVRVFISGFKNYEKMLVMALYSIYLKEHKSVEWFFETSIKVLELFEENSDQFKNIIRKNLETNVMDFIKKIETSYEVLNLFEALVPGIRDYFIKEAVINSLETK
jgi:hypothetical protein